MANITKLPSGKFRAQIRRSGAPSMSKTFTTQKKAAEWAAMMDKGITDGVIQDKLEAIRQDALVPTLREALDLYVREGCKDLKPDSRVSRMNVICRHPIGDMKITAITPGTIAAFRDDKKKEHTRYGTLPSGNYIGRQMAMISSMFSWYLEKQGSASEIPGLVSNPVMSVRKPKLPKPRARRLTEDEEFRILDSARNYSNPEAFAIILFGIETGARIGEILKVQWRDIDLDRGTAECLDTKNGEDREIPLMELTINTMRELKKHKKDDHPFHYKSGWNKVWKTILKRAGIDHKDLHFHDLRHEATSRLFERFNLTTMEAATVTGHKTLQMLQRYTHLKVDNIRQRMIENSQAGQPRQAEPAGQNTSAKDRLKMLKEMLDDKLITKKVYQEKSKAILADF